MQSLFESAFIAMLMFFWLLLMHSMAILDNVISIEDRSFFMPKVGVCGAYWVYLMLMRVQVYVLYAQNPFFDQFVATHINVLYMYIQAVGVIILTAYSLYFIIITVKALKTIRTLKKSYRYAMGLTMFTMAFSAAIMLQNGQASQRMDPPLFLGLLTLFNLYIQVAAFFYSPCIGIVSNDQFDVP